MRDGTLDATGWVNHRTTLAGIVDELPRLAADPGRVVKTVVEIGSTVDVGMSSRPPAGDAARRCSCSPTATTCSSRPRDLAPGLHLTSAGAEIARRRSPSALGHKVAARDDRGRERVVRCGVPIGSATAAIERRRVGAHPQPAPATTSRPSPTAGVQR